MNLDKRLDIYRTEYYVQIELKEKLYARLAIYAVLITACITANITMFDKLIDNSGLLLTVIIFLWEIEIVVLILILYGFLCVSHIKQDKWVNTSNDMEQYRNTIADHFDQYSNHLATQTDIAEQKSIYVDEQFSLYLVSQYSSCATVIRDNNVYRQRWLSWIMSFTYLLLLSTGILGILFLINKI